MRFTNLCAVTVVTIITGLGARAQSALSTFLPGTGEQEFGRSCCGIGDITGDGLADVVIGDPLRTPGQGFWGQVRVFNGATGQLIYAIDGTESSAEFGYSLANLGDLNGDGRSDFIVGS